MVVLTLKILQWRLVYNPESCMQTKIIIDRFWFGRKLCWTNLTLLVTVHFAASLMLIYLYIWKNKMYMIATVGLHHNEKMVIIEGLYVFSVILYFFAYHNIYSVSCSTLGQCFIPNSAPVVLTIQFMISNCSGQPPSIVIKVVLFSLSKII